MDQRPEDPSLSSSRREAVFVILLWAASMLYSVIYCYVYGYNRSSETLTFVWGFPDWVFWGIVAPWIVCVLVSWWFAYVFAADADLGTDPEPASGSQEEHDA